MKAITNFTYGKATYTFEFDEKDPMETLNQVITLSTPPTYCNVCKNTETFKFDTNKDKEANIYVNAMCKCGAKAKLGQYKSGGYFWHEFKVWERKDAGSIEKVTPA